MIQILTIQYSIRYTRATLHICNLETGYRAMKIGLKTK